MILIILIIILNNVSVIYFINNLLFDNDYFKYLINILI